jgi:hypothetical protein
MNAGQEGTSNIVRASSRGASARNIVTADSRSTSEASSIVRDHPTRAEREQADWFSERGRQLRKAGHIDPSEPTRGGKRRAESSVRPGASAAKRRHSSPPRMYLRKKLVVVLKPRKGCHPEAKRHLKERESRADKDDYLTCKSPQEKHGPCFKCGEIGHFKKHCKAIIENCSYCLEYQSYFDFAQDKTSGPLNEHAIEACVRLPYGCDWCKTRGHFDS